jgi:parallel beta-helix repeat protein
LAVLLAFSPAAKPAVIYVAPGGNDLASVNSPSSPLGTLRRAVEKAREIHSTQGGTVEILLRGGTYLLDGPLSLGPADSNLAVAAYPGEFPVISGGFPISGWHRTLGTPGVWRSSVPAGWTFRELFINGRRAQRSRWPKSGFYHATALSPTNDLTQLPVRLEDLDLSWAPSGDVELVALQAWAQSRNQIRAVNTNLGVVVLVGKALPNQSESNPRYFLENVPDALAPGEWHLDSRSGVVTYFPLPGERVDAGNIWASRLTDLVQIKGSKTHPVRGVVFRGIQFADTDWPLVSGSDMDVQGAVECRGAFQAEGATDCAIEKCVFTRLGGFAVDFGAGCERDRVEGNEMFDLGAGGVRLGETAQGRATAEPTRQNIISDNHIHDIGKVNMPAVGILVFLAGDNLIAHNEVDHSFYTAISVGWSWGYADTPCRKNIVEFNRLHDLGQGMLSDMAGIYTLGVQPGTMVRDNLIYDVNIFAYGGWGLYTDEGSTGIILESNIVHDCESAGFHQHYGRENIVRNNIFAFNKEGQLARTRLEKHLTLSVSNNIVYFDSGDLFSGNWGDDMVMDNNLYFDSRGTNSPADAQLKSWRARGHDLHSIVADPLFQDPQTYDFRLKPNSPALRIGFHPFTLDTVGPRAGRLVNWLPK